MDINKHQYYDLELLSDTIDMITKSNDFHGTAEIIFKFIKNFIKFDMAVIYKINEKDNALEIVSCLGSDTEKLKSRIPFKIGEGAVGLVAENKKPILINDALEFKGIKVRQYQKEDPIIRSFLAVPLVVGNKSIGILSVSSSIANQYNDYDVKMISILASQAAVLLELNINISETKRFSNKILDNVNSGIIVIDNDKKIIIFNSYAETITGFNSCEITGEDFSVLNLKLDNEDNFLYECFSNLKTYFEESGQMIIKEKNIIRIRISTSLMFNEEGVLKSCICIFRDYTEIEKLQRQIAMADKLTALGRLTAGLVHEIRNPLLPIRNASEYLLSKYGNENNTTEFKNLLIIIREESERLNRVLDQLVSLGKDKYDTIGNCSLKECVDEVLTLLNYTINKNDIELKLNFNNYDIYLPYSKDNLKQVLLNIILNSIDALKLNEDTKKCFIEFNIIKEEKNAIIHIIDNGVGVSNKDINKIFDPFYTTKEDGTGIGLSIAFNIVKGSSGDITIESDELKRTKVTLVLPLINERK